MIVAEEPRLSALSHQTMCTVFGGRDAVGPRIGTLRCNRADGYFTLQTIHLVLAVPPTLGILKSGLWLCYFRSMSVNYESIRVTANSGSSRRIRRLHHLSVKDS
jgi:hypothetical protein